MTIKLEIDISDEKDYLFVLRGREDIYKIDSIELFKHIVIDEIDNCIKEFAKKNNSKFLIKYFGIGICKNKLNV